MEYRPYTPGDCGEMAELFFNTVHSVNAKDYTEEELAAWATGVVNIESWNRSFLDHYTLVAVDGAVIVGFGDITHAGYLDRLFVHKDYQGMGIATALCDRLEAHCPEALITTHASLTARPFFEKRGYLMVKRQQVERLGVLLTNFVMVKQQP